MLKDDGTSYIHIGICRIVQRRCSTIFEHQFTSQIYYYCTILHLLCIYNIFLCRLARAKLLMLLEVCRNRVFFVLIIAQLAQHYSKSVIGLVQRSLWSFETLRPLVAPSLRSGCYSLGPSVLKTPQRPWTQPITYIQIPLVCVQQGIMSRNLIVSQGIISLRV